MLLPKLIAVLIGIVITYLITRRAKKRKLNIYWIIYLSLLMPLLGWILTLLRFNAENLKRKPSTASKVIAVVLMVYGIILLSMAISTPATIKTMPKTVLLENYENLGGIRTGNHDHDLFLNETTASIGRVIGGGILAISLDNSTFLSRDYRVRRYFRFYVGFLLSSVGVCLMKREKLYRPETATSNVIDPTQNDIVKPSFKVADNIDITQTINRRFMKQIKYIQYSAISIGIGIIFGWVFCKESYLYANLELVYHNYLFNWQLFFVMTLISMFLILFLFDNPFRRFLYRKLNFSDEKKSS